MARNTQSPSPSSRTRTTGALLVAISLGAAACGGSGGSDSAADKFEEVEDSIDGGSSSGDRGDSEGDAAESDDEGFFSDETEASEDVDSSADEAMEEESIEDDRDESSEASSLRAGAVDDNDDFPAFLAYQDQFFATGLPVRALDVSERHLVQVFDANQRSVPNALINIEADGQVVASVRTAADGTALVHPTAYDAIEPQDVVSISVGQAPAVELIRQDPGIVVINLDDIASRPQEIDLEIVFVLDATGSMGDEIGQLQATVDSVANSVQQLQGQPNVRMGLTHYRDIGDEYVTRTVDLTSDIDSFREDLNSVRADGGGDYPEALDEALSDALNRQPWSEPSTTTQLIFIVADAPPQADRNVDQPYDDSLRDAASRGIKVFPIASSGSSDDAEFVFRQMAQFTNARFVFLSYGAEGSAALGGETDIESADYDELPLDELIIRLVREEIEPLN